ncbi:zwei Ig domain protein zig-8-like isoform X1 [Babylonia areolata]|uniref:zwei Ig domain protein zig-8-like isoform X1 n=1 Tax=Babylonia areolata TaxID=304850 RepID=UPI003FD02DBD
MVQRSVTCLLWREVCTWCRLSHLLLFLPLLAKTVSIHDSVPPPKFLPGPSEVTVRQGEVAVLPCAVRHLGTKQVAWRRIDADDFLTIGEMTWIDDVKFSVDHTPRENDAGDWNLVIDKVTQDDVGVYECQVTSKLGFNKLVELKVVGPPVRDPEGGGPADQTGQSGAGRDSNILHNPVKRCGVPSLRGCLISIKGRRYVDLGQKIHLLCNASGGPRLPEDIDWFKDGDMIDSFKYPHVLIEKYQSIRDRAFISELMIDHAKESDAGEYVCRSSRNNIVNMKITVLKETKPPDPKRRDHGSVPESMSGSGCPQLCCGPLLAHVTLALSLLCCWTLRS